MNNYNSDDDDDNVLATHRLQQHQSDTTTSSSSTTKQPKKHISQQQNYSDTIVARSIMDDQVERPPIFSVLPRGAHKLSKNQTKKNKNLDDGSCGGDVDKEQRIRKEQQALEAMREKVMRQYSIMREKRRSGGVLGMNIHWLRYCLTITNVHVFNSKSLKLLFFFYTFLPHSHHHCHFNKLSVPFLTTPPSPSSTTLPNK